MAKIQTVFPIRVYRGPFRIGQISSRIFRLAARQRLRLVGTYFQAEDGEQPSLDGPNSEFVEQESAMEQRYLEQRQKAEVMEFVSSVAGSSMAVEPPVCADGALQVTPRSSAFDEALVAKYLPLVRVVAKALHARLPQHVELDEMVSAGVLGLLDAMQKFDAHRQVQFRSYAEFRIRGAILDSLRQLDWSPRELRRKGRAAREASVQLQNRLGREPSESEIAEAMKLTLPQYQQLISELKTLAVGSLNVDRSEDAAEDGLSCVPAPACENPLFQCLRGEQRGRLAAAIEALPEKERLVLTLYYYEELTMKEIGLVLGVVDSRISQIHSTAVARLRRSMGGTDLRVGHSATRKAN